MDAGKRVLLRMVNVNQIIGQIYDCVDDTAQWSGVLETLYRAFNCSAASFNRVWLPSGELIFTNPLGYDQSWIDDYQTKWHGQNPLPLGLAKFHVSRPMDARKSPVTQTMCLGADGYRKTDIFDALFSPADLYDFVALPVGTETEVFGISLWAGKRQREFSDSQLAKARILAPHLVRSKRLSDFLRYTKAFAKSGDINDISGPAFIIGLDRELLACNDEGAKSIGSELGIKIREGRLAFESAIIDSQLHTQLAAFDQNKTEMGKRRQVTSFSVAKELEATLYRLPLAPVYQTAAAARPEYLLRLSRCATFGEKLLKNAADDFSLTRTEQEIAVLLIDGLSPKDISAKRGTKDTTTRWHIRQIYQKLDVSNHRELIRKFVLQ